MISVIIPLYNKEPIIERTIRSVLSQDYNDFEVVIVNDGSTDKSIEVLEKALLEIKQELKVNSPVTIISQENSGPSKARNTGVKKAKGEWIVFLDADDELLPGALRRFADSTITYENADFINCPFYCNSLNGTKLFHKNINRHVKNPFKESFFGHFFPRTGSFMCKRGLLILNPFNEHIRRFEDLDVLYRIYHYANIYVISNPSMIVHQEFSSASHRLKDISEDFTGHLEFNGKTFWEMMCLYQLFLGERPNYPMKCRELYHFLRKRIDLYIIYQFLIRTKKLWI